MVDAVDPTVSAAVGGRLRARSSGVVGSHQRDDLVQSDSDDSEMDRLYALQLGRNTSRYVIVSSQNSSTSICCGFFVQKL